MQDKGYKYTATYPRTDTHNKHRCAVSNPSIRCLDTGYGDAKSPYDSGAPDTEDMEGLASALDKGSSSSLPSCWLQVCEAIFVPPLTAVGWCIFSCSQTPASDGNETTIPQTSPMSPSLYLSYSVTRSSAPSPRPPHAPGMLPLLPTGPLSTPNVSPNPLQSPRLQPRGPP